MTNVDVVVPRTTGRDQREATARAIIDAFTADDWCVDHRSATTFQVAPASTAPNPARSRSPRGGPFRTLPSRADSEPPCDRPDRLPR